MADRLAKNPKIPEFKRNIYAGGCWAELVDWYAPMLHKKPSVVGVQFMGDIAHPSVPRIDFPLLFDMMYQAPQHTYLTLTKRPVELGGLIKDLVRKVPDNCWLGVTVEDQKTADERIPALLQIPAAHYWISAEPLLASVDPGLLGTTPKTWGHGYETVGDLIEFIAAGGESGPGARPAHPDWFRSIRDQCEAAGVPFMFKQWGEWRPRPDLKKKPCGSLLKDWRIWTDDVVMERVGKKRAGRLLDGVEHMETPWEAPCNDDE